jgi:5-methylcytosine-specific restriction endonuclease McrA
VSLPFERYDQRGTELLGLLNTNSSSRRVYGLKVMKQCGKQCVYCDRDLASCYDLWLDLSIDHVIPLGHTTWAKVQPQLDWVRDLANCATCCRACNDWLNDS